MAAGRNFTVPAALYLKNQVSSSEMQVFYDHGGCASNRIYSWFGTEYTAPLTPHHLSWVDIVIAEPVTRRVHQIIEIEDSTAKPKTLIADLMAVLLGDGLAFGGRSDWQTGDWTSLVVLAYTATSRAQAKYRVRLDHVRQQVASVQPYLTTGNAAIRHIMLDTFKDVDELQEKLAGTLTYFAGDDAS